jgi:hypothetical protein
VLLFATNGHNQLEMKKLLDELSDVIGTILLMRFLSCSRKQFTAA